MIVRCLVPEVTGHSRSPADKVYAVDTIFDHFRPVKRALRKRQPRAALRHPIALFRRIGAKIGPLPPRLPQATPMLSRGHFETLGIVRSPRAETAVAICVQALLCHAGKGRLERLVIGIRNRRLPMIAAAESERDQAKANDSSHDTLCAMSSHNTQWPPSTHCCHQPQWDRRCVPIE